MKIIYGILATLVTASILSGATATVKTYVLESKVANLESRMNNIDSLLTEIRNDIKDILKRLPKGESHE